MGNRRRPRLGERCLDVLVDDVFGNAAWSAFCQRRKRESSVAPPPAASSAAHVLAVVFNQSRWSLRAFVAVFICAMRHAVSSCVRSASSLRGPPIRIERLDKHDAIARCSSATAATSEVNVTDASIQSRKVVTTAAGVGAPRRCRRALMLDLPELRPPRRCGRCCASSAGSPGVGNGNRTLERCCGFRKRASGRERARQRARRRVRR